MKLRTTLERIRKDPGVPARWIIGPLLALGLLTGGAPVVRGEEPADSTAMAVGQTPPRLSLVDGQVSFWRPGALDWVQAQVNTPLAPGDAIYTGSPGNLELQIGARAFLRAWANTQIGLENQEPDFLQFKVTAGHAAFDLRTLESGRAVEVDTPNAAFTIEHPGYYRVDVTGDRTAFITRRAGRATVTPASGETVEISPSEEIVIEGTSNSHVTSSVARPLDDWDRWNYARSNNLLDALSTRYVSPDMYGVSDLDGYGSWRVVPTYGPVWVPTGVPAGWGPYTTGSWVRDPSYGWTWVDAAPWGWAPYHYGRWVFVEGFWAWAPGPMIVRPVYAPALVAFFDGPRAGVRLGIGGPVVGWVPLGWGEPCVPWWGPAGFIHRPWWGGWGGPRVVNNVIINKTTVVNVRNITVYQNTHVHNAMVVVNERHFGHGPITGARVAQVDARSLQPIRTAPNVTATPVSFVPTASRGIRPPEDSLRRSVVVTRRPLPSVDSASRGQRTVSRAGISAPHLFSEPPAPEPAQAPPRPLFGQSAVERPPASRAQLPLSPKLKDPRPREQSSGGPPPETRQAPPARQRGLEAGPSSPATPPPLARRPEAPPPAADHSQPPALPRREVPGRPERSFGPPSPVTPQPRPERMPAGHSPATVQSLANHGQPPAPPRRELPPPVTRQAPPPMRPEPMVTRPSPVAPLLLARHPEPPPPSARPLRGEAANRLSPHRAEARPAAREERPALSAPVRPRKTPGNPSRD